MDTIYNYNNYEIILKKCVDSVYIQFLDKQLFKLYANTYIDVDVIKLTMGNLDMFYKVMSTVFESLSNNDDKATLEIFPSMKKLKLSIHHTFYLEFNFELQLNLIEEQSVNLIEESDDICIKKLQKSLEELTKKYNMLESYINDYMEITITDKFHCVTSVGTSYSIIINTPIIKIIDRKNFEPNFKDSENIYTLYTNCIVKYNNNFKMINCNKLIIDSDRNNSNYSFFSYDFGYDNLPLSITTLVIKIIRGSLLDNFKKINLPNLKSIEFDCCYELQTIYASITHLKSLKNITIKNCPKFQEGDLLLTLGYNLN